MIPKFFLPLLLTSIVSCNIRSSFGSPLFKDPQLDSIVLDFSKYGNSKLKQVDICFDISRWHHDEYYKRNVDTTIIVCFPGSMGGGRTIPSRCLGVGYLDGIKCRIFGSQFDTLESIVSGSKLWKPLSGRRKYGKNRCGSYRTYSYHRTSKVELLGFDGFTADGIRPRPFSPVLLYPHGPMAVYKDSVSADIIGNISGINQFSFVFFVISSSENRFNANVFLVDESQDSIGKSELFFLYRGWVDKSKIGGFLDCDYYINAKNPMLKLYLVPEESGEYISVDISDCIYFTFFSVDDIEGCDWFKVTVNGLTGWTRNIFGSGGAEYSYLLRYFPDMGIVEDNAVGTMTNFGVEKHVLPNRPLYRVCKDDVVYRDSSAIDIIGHVYQQTSIADFVLEVEEESLDMLKVNVYIVSIDGQENLIFLYSGWIKR